VRNRELRRTELTADEERAKDARLGACGWPRSSSFGPASGRRFI